ncbi:MAG: hypothetical protein H7323_14140, partial [Frankiales bacterium]|nr:hypothetical protein [Frankiales bacterium]
MTATPTRRPAAGPSRVTNLTQRAETVRAGRRTRRRRRLGRALLVAIPLAGLAWVLFGSSWLAVDRIEVVGRARVTVAQVEQAAAVP